VIVALAFYPQIALHKGEPTITRSVSAAGQLAGGGQSQTAAAPSAQPTP
jgi:hypothetical protein